MAGKARQCLSFIFLKLRGRKVRHIVHFFCVPRVYDLRSRPFAALFVRFEQCYLPALSCFKLTSMFNGCGVWLVHIQQ